jgi:DNA-binding GntR family transcriptional regulator
MRVDGPPVVSLMAPSLPSVQSVPNLTEQVHSALTAAVLDGTLDPGEIHSVSALATQLGVSRTPVREAMLQLARRGLVEVVRNQGFVIVEPSVADLDHIFQVRLWLEVPATRAAAELATDRDKAAIGSVAEELEAAARSGDLSELERVDRALHKRILETGGNLRAVRIVDDLRDFLLTHRQTTVGRTRDAIAIVREHDPIVAGIAANDPDMAGEGMRSHLESTREASLRQAGEEARQLP